MITVAESIIGRNGNRALLTLRHVEDGDRDVITTNQNTRTRTGFLLNHSITRFRYKMAKVWTSLCRWMREG